MSDYDEGASSGSQVAGCLVKLISHGIALLSGLIMGIVIPIAYEHFENPELMASPEADFSRAELIAKLEASEKMYQELLDQTSKLDAEQKEQLTQASSKVVTLEGQVAKTEQEIEVIKAKLKKTEGKSAARKKELEQKEAELAALRAELEVAVAEKARLTQELEVSRAETVQARAETQVARDETNAARADEAWAKFQADAYIRICKKGTTNKMERCREEVKDALYGHSKQFKDCVLSGQASPRMIEVEDKRDVTLPRFSKWFDQNSDFSKDRFYITFCDPDLPEAGGLDPL
jgi:myosin heavy subunit